MPPLSLKHVAALSLFAVFTLLGCADPGANDELIPEASIEVDVAPPATAEPSLPENADYFPARKLIKDGTLAFAVTSLDSARWHITSAVERHGGYVSEEQTANAGFVGHSFSLTARVPAGQFDALLADVGRGVTEFDERSVSVSDVTADVTDLEARLRTRRDLEERYRALLVRAENVEEILSVERQLGEVREQVEVAEGQLRYLNDRSAMSTLRVRIYAEATDDRQHPAIASLASGWSLFEGIILGVLSVWPFVLLFAGIAYLFVLRNRRTRAAPATR